MLSLKKVISFLFIADISGSMYGQKIAAVNAAVAECIEELRLIDASEERDIEIGFAAFHEKMVTSGFKEVSQIIPPHYKVEPDSDGFYFLTSFQCLYRGLFQIMENLSYDQNHIFYIFLITDGKVADPDGYTADLERLKSNPVFRNARRYAASLEENADIVSNEMLEFAGYQKADRVIKLSDLSGEISKLKLLAFESEADVNAVFRD